MIPRCFPTEYATANGTTKIKINVLEDTTGLKEWIDFIPVQNIFDDPYTVNSYDADGAMEASVIDPSGLQAGLDYINVYEDGSKTVAWTTDANGYIPINYEVA